MRHLLLTHDLSCTLGQLAAAACRYPGDDRVLDVTARPACDLVVAAVAFTIQLAIDEGGRDPDEMRALERDLIARLEARR